MFMANNFKDSRNLKTKNNSQKEKNKLKANNNKNKTKNISSAKKNIDNNKNIEVNNINRNTYIMKTLTFLGVIIFCFILIYLMYHFFVENSDIKVNMSTDKKIEYISVNNKDEMIITQKYVSDLSYSMRYDINEFRVFKHKGQDIYKNLNDERVLVAVEKSTLPSNCTKITSANEYNSCYIKSDDFTEYYYITSSDITYEIIIKTPGQSGLSSSLKANINQMLKSFNISI